MLSSPAKLAHSRLVLALHARAISGKSLCVTTVAWRQIAALRAPSPRAPERLPPRGPTPPDKKAAFAQSVLP
eukprot:3118764-Pyramimonas_sp.AAC.1